MNEDPAKIGQNRVVNLLINDFAWRTFSYYAHGAFHLAAGTFRELQYRYRDDCGNKIAAVSEDQFYVYLSGLRKLGWNENKITVLRNQIEPIIGTNLSPVKNYPSFRLSLLSDSVRMAGFSEFLRNLVNTLRES